MLPKPELEIIRKLPGNDCCCECYRLDTDWACVSFGILLCLECAGRHRSLGVKVSFIRSIYLDTWSQKEIEILKHGGNGRFKLYLQQLNMGYNGDCDPNAYLSYCKSEAAQSYKSKLLQYVEDIIQHTLKSADVCNSNDSNALFSSTVVEIYEEEIDSCGNIILIAKSVCHVTPVKTLKSKDIGDTEVEPSEGSNENSLDHAAHSEYIVSFNGLYASFGFKLALKELHETEDKLANYAIVCHVDDNGLAAVNNVKLGDIVVALNDEPISEFDEVMELINGNMRDISIKFMRLLNSSDISSAIKVSPRSRRRFSFQQGNGGIVSMFSVCMDNNSSIVVPEHRNENREELADHAMDMQVSKQLQFAGVTEGAEEDIAKGKIELDEMESLLLSEVEKSYLNKTHTASGTGGGSSNSVHNTVQAYIDTKPPLPVHHGSQNIQNVHEVASVAASHHTSTRIPFQQHTPDGRSTTGDAELEAEPEDGNNSDENSNSNRPHNLQVLLEEISLEDVTSSSTSNKNKDNGEVAHVSSHPASIKLRQASYNSWEYEVLFLTTPYGFTLSKSSAINQSVKGQEGDHNAGAPNSSGIVSKVLEKSKAAQQGVEVGDTVIAVNRVYTPTYDDVLVQLKLINQANQANADTALRMSSSQTSSTAGASTIPLANHVPVIFLLRRSLGYFINNTTTMLATESRKLLDDTLNLSMNILRTMSPSTPPVAATNRNMYLNQANRSTSSLGSGTASIILNTSNISPVTTNRNNDNSRNNTQQNSPIVNNGIAIGYER